MVKNLFKKGSLLAIGAVMLMSLFATAVTSIVSSQPVEAAAKCAEHADKVNIVYKGVDCSTQTDTVSKFKSVYNSNKSGHSASPSVKKDYTDIKTIYNWAGASQSMIDGLNNSNTKFGTLYKDGRVTVNGETVATDASVTARFNGGKGFSHVTSNIYARKTTTNFAQSSAKVLVVYKANGQVAFAVMVDCGNAIKVTPKPPKEEPKPSLTCDQLIFNSRGTDNKSFTFTAKATAKNTTITGYDFAFGDGQTKTVATSASTAKVDHDYAKAGTYTATVKVDGKDKKDVTSSNCSVKVTIAPPQAVLTCDQLTFSNKDKEYTFNAKASSQNTEITNYDFDFGDGSAKKTVNTAAKTASAAHTYAKSGTYTAYVTVSSKDKKNVTSAKCAVKITIETPMCEVPGKEHLPKDSPECVETPVLTCDELVISQNGSNKLAQSFVVKASAKHTTISTYTVNFGDGATYTGADNAVNHTYAKAGTYKVTASVSSKEKPNVTSAACAGTVTIETPMCEVPGKEDLPVDSPECKETPEIPETPETPTTPEAPAELPKTGAAGIAGLFTGFSLAGGAAHRLWSRRKTA